VRLRHSRLLTQKGAELLHSAGVSNVIDDQEVVRPVFEVFKHGEVAFISPRDPTADRLVRVVPADMTGRPTPRDLPRDVFETACDPAIEVSNLENEFAARELAIKSAEVVRHAVTEAVIAIIDRRVVWLPPRRAVVRTKSDLAKERV
jgi:hypothetical protein